MGRVTRNTKPTNSQIKKEQEQVLTSVNSGKKEVEDIKKLIKEEKYKLATIKGFIEKNEIELQFIKDKKEKAGKDFEEYNFELGGQISLKQVKLQSLNEKEKRNEELDNDIVAKKKELENFRHFMDEQRVKLGASIIIAGKEAEDKVKERIDQLEANMYTLKREVKNKEDEKLSIEKWIENGEDTLSGLNKEIEEKGKEIKTRVDNSKIEIKKNEERAIDKLLRVGKETKESEDNLSVLKNSLADYEKQEKAKRKEIDNLLARVSLLKSQEEITIDEIVKNINKVKKELVNEKAELDKIKGYRFELIRRGKEMRRLYADIGKVYEQAGIPLPKIEEKELIIPE